VKVYVTGSQAVPINGVLVRPGKSAEVEKLGPALQRLVGTYLSLTPPVVAEAVAEIPMSRDEAAAYLRELSPKQIDALLAATGLKLRPPNAGILALLRAAFHLAMG
jgi:hypothetical protein